MKHVVVADNCVFNKDTLPDVQNTHKDFHPIQIKKVGVRNVEVPIPVWQHDENKPIQTHATFSAYVELTEESKGINMSRCGRVIMAEAAKHKDVGGNTSTLQLMQSIAKNLQNAHLSQTAYVKARFSYPSWTKVYASKLDTVEYIDVVWETIADGDEVTHLLTVENVGISLCPCSKEMSLLKNNLNENEKAVWSNWELMAKEWPTQQHLMEKLNNAGFGAHNQRSHVAVTVQLIPGQQLWFEDLIAITDKSFSAPIRAILKREDEKVEGELAYLGGYYDDKGFNPVEGTGPKFVEDISRDAAQQLNTLLDTKIADYVVVCRNMESIHSRNLEAVAVLTAGRNLQ
jgi:GTP cyclohydrolase I